MALGIHLKAGIGILRWRSPYLCREAAAAASAVGRGCGGTLRPHCCTQGQPRCCRRLRELLGSKAFPAFSILCFADSLWLPNEISGMWRSTRSPSLPGLPRPAGCSARWGRLAPDGHKCLPRGVQHSSPGAAFLSGCSVPHQGARGCRNTCDEPQVRWPKPLGRVLLHLPCHPCRSSVSEAPAEPACFGAGHRPSSATLCAGSHIRAATQDVLGHGGM